MVTFARRLWLRGRVRCGLCGKICAAMIPRGGDGSMVVPARHKDRRVIGTFDFCEGRFMAGNLVGVGDGRERREAAGGRS